MEIPAGYLTKRALAARGWTRTLLARLRPQPALVLTAGGGQVLKLYAAAKVSDASRRGGWRGATKVGGA